MTKLKTQNTPSDLGRVQPKELINHKILILGLAPPCPCCPAYATTVVYARLRNGSLLHFAAPTVVERQCEALRVPTWAKLYRHQREGSVKSGEHDWYWKLALAETISKSDIKDTKPKRKPKKKKNVPKCKTV